MSATNPLELRPDIFGTGVFDQDFERILSVMSTATKRDVNSKDHMAGIIQQIQSSPRDNLRIDDLKIYLTELDRRRGTSWPTLFPWLVPLGSIQT